MVLYKFIPKFQFKSNHAISQFKTFKSLWMINANTIHILVLYTISYGSLIIPKIHFHIQYFTISNQLNYAHKFNSVMSINSVMPLTNLTYVFDIQDIKVIDTVPLGCRPVSNGFITQYGPARLLTGYKQSISEHYRYGLAWPLIRVTHQYNSSQYCYLTPIGIPIYP